jgi:hypothetical protein
MFTSRHHATEQKHNIKVANKSSENADKVQIFRNEVNKPELHSQKYYGQTTFVKYLLPCSSQYFAFPATT